MFYLLSGLFWGLSTSFNLLKSHKVTHICLSLSNILTCSKLHLVRTYLLHIYLNDPNPNHSSLNAQRNFFFSFLGWHWRWTWEWSNMFPQLLLVNNSAHYAQNCFILVASKLFCHIQEFLRPRKNRNPSDRGVFME